MARVTPIIALAALECRYQTAGLGNGDFAGKLASIKTSRLN